MGQNILDRYPGATLELYRNDVLIPEEDYVSEGISLNVVDGFIVLTTPDIGNNGYVYQVRIVTNAITEVEPMSLVSLEFLDEQPHPDLVHAGFIDSGSSPVEELVADFPPPALPITVTFDWQAAIMSAGREGA